VRCGGDHLDGVVHHVEHNAPMASLTTMA
jgi:hypothetical protein